MCILLLPKANILLCLRCCCPYSLGVFLQKKRGADGTSVFIASWAGCFGVAPNSLALVRATQALSCKIRIRYYPVKTWSPLRWLQVHSISFDWIQLFAGVRSRDGSTGLHGRTHGGGQGYTGASNKVWPARDCLATESSWADGDVAALATRPTVYSSTVQVKVWPLGLLFFFF
jgi:hypothetical protein